MTPVSNLGIAFSCLGDPNSLIRSAEKAERAGFRDIWLVEVQDADTLALAASISQVTKKIGIATGVANSQLRLPTLLAMGAATLSNLSHGRFVLGVGAGSPPMQFTAPPKADSPLVRLRETLQILPLILAGGSVSFRGKLFRVDGFTLTFKPRSNVPVYGAAMGLKTLEVVAELADGAILMLPTLKHLKEMVRRIEPVLNRRGLKTSSFPIACHLVTALSDEPRKARRLAKQAVARYASIPAYRASFERMGFAEELRAMELARTKKGTDAWESVPTEMADSLIIHGNLEECAEKIARFANAGVTRPIVYPFMPDSRQFPRTIDAMISSFGKVTGDS